jgi:intracellular sulfur oxidation DsrE/DsrF family protein
MRSGRPADGRYGVSDGRLVLYIINSDTIGRGHEGLGRQLMAKIVAQLLQQTPRPDAIAFYNSGVKLLAHKSLYLDGFRALEEAGVDLIACGTCVDEFKLRDDLGAGRVSDMREIVATMNAAVKVVTL